MFILTFDVLQMNSSLDPIFSLLINQVEPVIEGHRKGLTEFHDVGEGQVDCLSRLLTQIAPH